MSFKEWHKAWLKSLEVELSSPLTRKNYAIQFQQFLNFFKKHLGKEINLDDFVNLTRQDIRSWMAYRSSENYTMGTTYNAFGSAKSFVRFLMKSEQSYPAIFLEFRLPRKEKKLPRPIDKQDALKSVGE